MEKPSVGSQSFTRKALASLSALMGRRQNVESHQPVVPRVEVSKHRVVSGRKTRTTKARQRRQIHNKIARRSRQINRRGR